MNARIKVLFKFLLRRFRLFRHERREMLNLKSYQLAVKNRMNSGGGAIYLVGCGTMGRQIAAATKKLEGFTLAGTFDLNPEASQTLNQKISVQPEIAADLDTLINNIPQEGILAIATTAQSHVEIARKAIEKGVSKIFLEKPIATSIMDANVLGSVVEKNNVCLYIDHVRRWVPSVLGVRRMLENGAIGEVNSLHYTFGRAGIAMIGTHLFDFSRWLFNSDISKLRASLDSVLRPNWRGQQFNDHSGRVEMIMENGVIVHLDLSDKMILQQDCYTIYGSTGRIEVDQRNCRIRLIGSSGRVWEEYYPWAEMIPVGLGNALIEINENKAPRCSWLDGLKALEATIACYKSDRENSSWVMLPLKDEQIRNENFPFA